MRLFVAMDIPEATRAALSDLTTRLKTNFPAARWVNLAGVHITLRFIGEVPAEKLDKIRQALGSLLSFPPINLRFAGLGFFPNARRPRVLWAGVEAAPQLAQLAAAIEDALAPLGIPAENRDFHPHLTLARFESPRESQGIGVTIESLGTPDFGGALSSEFHLYQSVLKRSGAEYTRLVTYPLQGELTP